MRVFITGSADGLGQLSARQLIAEGHEVVLHARSEARGRDALAGAPGAAGVLVADLGSVTETRRLAEAANASGRFDGVIHNAGVYALPRRVETDDGLSLVFAVNVLAPYLLTALMTRPDRLVYLTSGLHRSGDPDALADLQWERRTWSGMQAYSESKLLDVVLAFAVARRWPEVVANAVEPGWVPTKMGGPGAPDDLELGADTQAWLAVSDDPEATASGRVLHHRGLRDPHPAAHQQHLQDGLLEACRQLTNVGLGD
jgi:NAD(P)-dependent dehydrogenase (short-subunit alcohol dehydrogenase family)